MCSRILPKRHPMTSADSSAARHDRSTRLSSAVSAKAVISDIRPAHVPVFAGLEPGGTRISTLASRAGVTRQAMGAMVREVEALGYIKSGADPQDARATLVRLTDTGIEFCRTVIDISTTINNELDLVLGEPASERLRSQLRVIAEYR